MSELWPVLVRFLIMHAYPAVLLAIDSAAQSSHDQDFVAKCGPSRIIEHESRVYDRLGHCGIACRKVHFEKVGDLGVLILGQAYPLRKFYHSKSDHEFKPSLHVAAMTACFVRFT